jgi:hypothetical protein
MTAGRLIMAVSIFRYPEKALSWAKKPAPERADWYSRHLAAPNIDEDAVTRVFGRQQAQAGAAKQHVPPNGPGRIKEHRKRARKCAIGQRSDLSSGKSLNSVIFAMIVTSHWTYLN